MKSTTIILSLVSLLCLASCKKESQISPAVTNTAPDIQDLGMNASFAPFNVPILIAGKKDVPGFINGAGSNARFAGPGPIFVNADGTLLVAEGTNNAIRKITSGVVSTVVSNGDFFQLQDIASINDGTIAANLIDYIAIYKKGQNTPEYFFGCFHCTLSGIDRDPSGNYFWYLEMNLTPTTTDSYLVSLNSALGSPKDGGEISNTQRLSSVSSAGPNKFFTTDDNHVLEQTAGGTVFQVVTTTFNRLTDIAANKSATKIFLVDNGDIKVINRCPSCIPKKSPTVTVLASGIDASGVALSNSESVLFFTSSKHNTVNKINLP